MLMLDVLAFCFIFYLSLSFSGMLCQDFRSEAEVLGSSITLL